MNSNTAKNIKENHLDEILNSIKKDGYHKIHTLYYVNIFKDINEYLPKYKLKSKIEGKYTIIEPI